MSTRVKFDLFKEIGKTQRLFSLRKIKSLISFSVLSSTKFAVVKNQQKSLLAALYFRLGIYQILKPNN